MLLIENPKFQEEIVEIRKRFKVPLSGIKTNEESEKWHREFEGRNDNYLSSENREKLRVEIERLEKEKKFQEGFNLYRKFNNDTPINALHIVIKKVLENFKLPLHWEHTLKRYILFNSIDLMWLPGNVSIREDFDLDTDLKRLSIEIDDTTTLEDIKYAWPTVKFHQKKLQSYTKKKIQPIKNFKRDQEAYNLRQSGKPYNEIADILTKKFDKVITSEDIASYIKRYKKSVGIN